MTPHPGFLTTFPKNFAVLTKPNLSFAVYNDETFESSAVEKSG